MPEKFNYYKEEMTRILPVDEYGVSIQIRTTKGYTKWLALNPESFRELQSAFKNEVTCAGEFPEPDNNELETGQ